MRKCFNYGRIGHRKLEYSNELFHKSRDRTVESDDKECRLIFCTHQTTPDYGIERQPRSMKNQISFQTLDNYVLFIEVNTTLTLSIHGLEMLVHPVLSPQ